LSLEHFQWLADNKV
jgi:nuclear pore complex protein Nup98-Nup96